VVRILGLLKITQMAGAACRRQALKLTHCRALVAIFALHGGVSTQQREAILVIFHGLDGDVPALNRMALCAVRAHFPLVDVVVTILTILANVGEHGLDMALGAAHLLVHGSKRVLGFIVVKFRNRADRLPSSGRVAILTGYGEGTVRTSSGLPLSGERSTCGRPRQKYEPTQNMYAPSRNAP